MYEEEEEEEDRRNSEEKMPTMKTGREADSEWTKLKADYKSSLICILPWLKMWSLSFKTL